VGTPAFKLRQLRAARTASFLAPFPGYVEDPYPTSTPFGVGALRPTVEKKSIFKRNEDCKHYFAPMLYDGDVLVVAARRRTTGRNQAHFIRT
jgi:hypothetical protein